MKQMATAAIALDQWNAEYYETMAAAARVRLAVLSGANHLRLASRFRSVANDFDELLRLLTDFETLPSTVLLEERAQEIPGMLRALFRKACGVLEAAESKGLTRNWLMAGHIKRINLANQRIAEFADRFEAAQKKLRTYVPPEQTQAYTESIRAYKDCDLTSDVADSEDVKSDGLALRF
jgi:hypothetical protein